MKVYFDGEPEKAIGGNYFLISQDDTDHMQFVCGECLSQAHIIEIKRMNRMVGVDCEFTLYFYLGCPNCGLTGQRKLYINDKGPRALFAHNIFEAGTLTIFGIKGKAYEKTCIFTPDYKEATKA